MIEKILQKTFYSFDPLVSVKNTKQSILFIYAAAVDPEVSVEKNYFYLIYPVVSTVEKPMSMPDISIGGIKKNYNHLIYSVVSTVEKSINMLDISIGEEVHGVEQLNFLEKVTEFFALKNP